MDVFFSAHTFMDLLKPKPKIQGKHRIYTRNTELKAMGVIVLFHSYTHIANHCKQYQYIVNFLFLNKSLLGNFRY